MRGLTLEGWELGGGGHLLGPEPKLDFMLGLKKSDRFWPPT